MKSSLWYLLFFASLLSAQTSWVKYCNNPVLVKTNLVWEFFAIGQPTAIKDNDTFKMWYAGCGIDHRSRFFYTYSTNGINWTKYFGGTPVLNIGNTGEWDSKWLDTPEIVKTPYGYYLYYYGDDVDTFPPHNPAIGLATSINGINWTKHPQNPLLTKGDSTSWEGKWIESPAVLYDNGIFKMWYTGVGYDWKIKIGYATSADGITWTKYPQNPVFDVGEQGSWDDFWVGVPAVIKNGNRFEMWYSALSQADLSNNRYDTIRIGYAYSTDGINWTRYSGNPVLSTLTPPYNPAVDSNGPWAPDVVFDGSSYHMWYETAAGFCYATAPLSITETQSAKTISPIKITPNPFSNVTFILFPGAFSVRIYDISGRIVRELQGQDKIIWNSKDNHNRKVRNGIYLGLIENPTGKWLKKLVVLQ
ncbi:MAG: T9SS type A sorting domain-containing protein [candidate division WOR-3 bacterium]